MRRALSVVVLSLALSLAGACATTAESAPIGHARPNSSPDLRPPLATWSMVEGSETVAVNNDNTQRVQPAESDVLESVDTASDGDFVARETADSILAGTREVPVLTNQNGRLRMEVEQRAFRLSPEDERRGTAQSNGETIPSSASGVGAGSGFDESGFDANGFQRGEGEGSSGFPQIEIEPSLPAVPSSTTPQTTTSPAAATGAVRVIVEVPPGGAPQTTTTEGAAPATPATTPQATSTTSTSPFSLSTPGTTLPATSLGAQQVPISNEGVLGVPGLGTLGTPLVPVTPEQAAAAQRPSETTARPGVESPTTSVNRRNTIRTGPLGTGSIGGSPTAPAGPTTSQAPVTVPPSR